MIVSLIVCMYSLFSFAFCSAVLYLLVSYAHVFDFLVYHMYTITIFCLVVLVCFALMMELVAPFRNNDCLYLFNR